MKVHQILVISTLKERPQQANGVSLFQPFVKNELTFETSEGDATKTIKIQSAPHMFHCQSHGNPELDLRNKQKSDHIDARRQLPTTKLKFEKGSFEESKNKCRSENFGGNILEKLEHNLDFLSQETNEQRLGTITWLSSRQAGVSRDPLNGDC